MTTKFILVDDHRQALDELVSAVNHLYPNSKILTALNGNEAFSLFNDNPDTKLIFSDVMMPVCGGFELASKVLESQQSAPIVFVTGTWTADYLGKIALAQILPNTPIAVAQKRFYYTTDEEFYGGLRIAISEAESRHAKISQIAPNYIDKLNKLGLQMLQEIDSSIATYLEARLKEFIAPIVKYADKLKGKGEVLDNLAKVLLELPEDAKLTELRSRDLLHDMTNTFYSIGVCLYLSKIKDDVKQDIVKAIDDKGLKTLNDSLRVFASLNHYLGHVMFRSDIPKHYSESFINYTTESQIKPISRDYPQKLYSIDVMSELLSTVPPYFVIRPNETLDDKITDFEKLNAQSKAVIARTASLAEYGYGDDKHPLAGFSGSIGNIRNKEELGSAINKLRTEPLSETQYYAIHHLQEPDNNQEFIIIMKDTLHKYEGRLLEHPNIGGRFILEFWEREFEKMSDMRRANYYAVYDANKREIINTNLSSYIADFLPLAKSLTSEYYMLLNSGKFDENRTYQLENGFTEPSKHSTYQFRPSLFRTGIINFDMQPTENDAIFKNKSFGVTPENGIEMVVFTRIPNEHIGRYGLAEKTFAIKQFEGREVCFIVDPEKDPNSICYAHNVGLVITGKGYAIQSHGYFNAMMHANRVLMLTPKELKDLGLQQGDIIHYRSNGESAGIKRITDYEPFFREVNRILNTTFKSSP